MYNESNEILKQDVLLSSSVYLLIMGILNIIIGIITYNGVDLGLGDYLIGIPFMIIGSLYTIVGLLPFIWFRAITILFIMGDMTLTHIFNIYNTHTGSYIIPVMIIWIGGVILYQTIRYKVITWND